MKRWIMLFLVTLLCAAPAFADEWADDYMAAFDLLQSGQYADASQAFSALGYYSDSSLMAIYSGALAAGENGSFASAALHFDSLGNFRDSALQARYYTARLYESAKEYEKAGELLTSMTLFRDSAARLLTYPAFIIERDAAALEAQNAKDYAAALQAEENQNYVEAYAAFSKLGDYRDSAAHAAALESKGRYAQAMQYVMNGQFKKAHEIFVALDDYEDSKEKAYVLGVTTFADSIRNQGNGVALFKFHDKWGILNVNSNIASTPYWDDIEDVNEYSLALVNKGGLYGYIDTDGKLVISAKWEKLSPFCNGVCVGATSEKNPNYSSSPNYPLILMDTAGNILTENKWCAVAKAHNTYWDGRNSLYFIESFSFTGDLIRVQNTAGLWGYVDLNGNVVIKPQYAEAKDFSEGLAAVKENSFWKYIDADNNTVVSGEYTDVTDFANNQAHVYKQDTGWQIIDTTGSVLYFTNEDNESQESRRGLADGEYIGVGTGFSGEIRVKVTISHGSIAGVEVVSHKETASIGGNALNKLCEDVVNNQSADIDTISGATYTSKGFIATIQTVLQAAGGQ